MRTTVFELRSGGVVTDVREEPGWRPFEEYDGKPLERIRVQDLLEPTGALFQLVEIAKGGSFAMHSSPDVAFCQIVRRRGKLGLPDGGNSTTKARSSTSFCPARCTTGTPSRRTRSSRSASFVSRPETCAWPDHRFPAGLSQGAVARLSNALPGVVSAWL
jgi:hypothetical protein